MFTSIAGRAFIQRWERCELKAYRKFPNEPWTIGWGHTGKEVHEGLVWTQLQADAQFYKDIAHAEDCINSSVSVPLTQGEFDALVSWVHNLGCGALHGSTLLRLLNDSDYDGAVAEFTRWDHINHQEVEGLLHRRREEQVLWEGNYSVIGLG